MDTDTERERERKKERERERVMLERKIDWHQLGIEPTTLECALTSNWTHDLSV